MKLFIFDLDQTLVDVTDVHDKVIGKLFKEQFNIEASLYEIDFAGKDLRQNIGELAGLKSITAEEYKGKSGNLLQRYDAIFAETMPADAGKNILPGVNDLLNQLSRTQHIISLYTGDSAEVVNSVLKATGLEHYFRFRFYGTEVETRADMVKLAIEKAEKIVGRDLKNKDIVIIGDSIRDIECGKIFNAITVAVATGFHSIDQLSKESPDFLFEDLHDYRKVLKVILERN